MTNHLKTSTNSVAAAAQQSSIRKIGYTSNPWTIWHFGAGIGLLGGIFILFGALFLTIFQFIYRENPHGSWLFAVVLPLWIIGAHCFDKIEEIDKARRLDYCKRHGVTDEKCGK